MTYYVVELYYNNTYWYAYDTNTENVSALEKPKYEELQTNKSYIKKLRKCLFDSEEQANKIFNKARSSWSKVTLKKINL